MNDFTSELARVADQLERSVRGGAWHGPSVREVLEGVNVDPAASKVLPNCHTAWEVLVHMTAWTRATRQALQGKTLDLNDREDWPAVSENSSSWKQAKTSFFEESDLLLTELGRRSDQILTERVPGREYDFYHLLHGLVQHNLYHAGQIRLLTKGP